MGDERFSALALLNIESDLTAALNAEDLVQMYATTGTIDALSCNDHS